LHNLLQQSACLTVLRWLFPAIVPLPFDSTAMAEFEPYHLRPM
jgi:hypothetical protein